MIFILVLLRNNRRLIWVDPRRSHVVAVILAADNPCQQAIAYTMAICHFAVDWAIDFFLFKKSESPPTCFVSQVAYQS